MEVVARVRYSFPGLATVRQWAEAPPPSALPFHWRIVRGRMVVGALQELVERCPRHGFRKLFKLLRKAGRPWSHKRLHRIHSTGTEPPT